MFSPQGAIGLKFGEDAGAAAARLSLRCEQWQPWEGGEGFEFCSDVTAPVQAFGSPSSVRLIRKGTELEAIELTFRNCAAQWSRLCNAVSEEFRLRPSTDADIYEIWSSGEVVHLAHDQRDDTCSLTVGSRRFGKVYRSYQLRQGLGSLGSSMRPH